MQWDPEIDTPATILIIGAGPVGIEAALYARFLGYSVIVVDSSRVGAALSRYGDRKMHAPWREVTSSLGLAALEAQGGEPLPLAEEVPTYREYVEKYLVPVAKTDLLYESIQFNSTVVSLSRVGCPNEHALSGEQRAELEFRVLIDSRQRGEFSQLVDIIVDCGGLSRREGLASGGGLAVGELPSTKAMHSGKCDFATNPKPFAEKHTLLYGNGIEACLNAVEWHEAFGTSENTKLTWVIPKRIGKSLPLFELPSASAPDEPSGTNVADTEVAGTNVADTEFELIREKAAQLHQDNSTSLVTLPAWGLDAVTQLEDETWSVRIQTREDESLDVACDQLINCANPTRNWSFLAGLTANQPLPDQPMATAEPHYYVLGQKALGNRRCTISEGHTQIREAFALIGGRKELDLYATVKPQG